MESRTDWLTGLYAMDDTEQREALGPFADWLEEHDAPKGDPERAQLIQLSLALDALPLDAEQQRLALTTQRETLMDNHCDRFLEEDIAVRLNALSKRQRLALQRFLLDNNNVAPLFPLGIWDGARLAAVDLLNRPQALQGCRTFEITDAHGVHVQAFQHDLMRDVRRLTVEGCSDRIFEAIAASERLDHLQALYIPTWSANPMRWRNFAEGIDRQSLRSRRNLPKHLRHLELRNMPDGLFQAITNVKWRRLRTLIAADFCEDEEHQDALRETLLDLYASFPRLRYLDLRNNLLDPSVVSDILLSSHETLERTYLDDAVLDAVQDPIVLNPTLESVKQLRMDHLFLSRTGFTTRITSVHLESMRASDLGLLTHLLQHRSWQSLSTIHVTSNCQQDKLTPFLAALLHAPLREHLQHLHLHLPFALGTSFLREFSRQQWDALTSFHCDVQMLEDMGGLAKVRLGEAVPALRDFSLYCDELSPAFPLFALFPQPVLQQLEKFTLHKIPLDQDSLDYLTQQPLPHLQSLILYGETLPDLQWIARCEMPALKNLNISEYPFQHEDIGFVLEQLQRFPQLEEFVPGYILRPDLETYSGHPAYERFCSVVYKGYVVDQICE